MITEVFEKLFKPIGDEERDKRIEGGADIESFGEGQRVILLANEEEGWPEERGIVVEYEGDDTYIVAVDDKYRDGPGDDGIREIMVEFLAAEE